MSRSSSDLTAATRQFAFGNRLADLVNPNQVQINGGGRPSRAVSSDRQESDHGNDYPKRRPCGRYYGSR